MSDQVVQLARDPRPFVRHGRASGLLPVPLERPRGLGSASVSPYATGSSGRGPRRRRSRTIRAGPRRAGRRPGGGGGRREDARNHRGHADGGSATVGVPAEGVDRQQDREPGLSALAVEPVVGDAAPTTTSATASGGDARRATATCRPPRGRRGAGAASHGAPDLHLDGDEEEQHEQRGPRATFAASPCPEGRATGIRPHPS